MENHRTASRAIRVMQSFGPPRATTNPYIHMLDEALSETPGVDHLRFHRLRALFGRYDALHFHWPETLFGGSTPARSVARRAFAVALRARLALTPVAVVRTVHNLEPHAEASPWEQRYLRWLDRRTDHRIVLSAQTPSPPGAPTTLIPHGHYRGWFAHVPPGAPTPGMLAFVGLVRPYKGVEDLLDAFSATADARPDLRLRVAGRPTSDTIERAVRQRASRDPRIELDLRYLSEDEFANTVRGCEALVLPFRSMHNSGSLLAVLSLERPVLVPRTAVTEALAAEVGPGWVTIFDGPLTGEHVRRFVEGVQHRPPTAPPDLTRRGWDDAGSMHRAAFTAAIARRRGARA